MCINQEFLKHLDGKQHSHPVTGKALSTAWPCFLQMDKNIYAFLSASLGGLAEVSVCFKQLSDVSVSSTSHL